MLISCTAFMDTSAGQTPNVATGSAGIAELPDELLLKILKQIPRK